MDRLFSSPMTDAGDSDEEEATDTTSSSDDDEEATSDRERAANAAGGGKGSVAEETHDDDQNDDEEDATTTGVGEGDEAEDVVAVDLFAPEPDTNPVEDIEERADPEPAGQEYEEPEDNELPTGIHPELDRASYLPPELRAGIEDQANSPTAVIDARRIDDATRRLHARQEHIRTRIADNDYAQLLYKRDSVEHGQVWAIPDRLLRAVARSCIYPNERRAVAQAHARAATRIARKTTAEWIAVADINSDSLATILNDDEWAVLVL